MEFLNAPKLIEQALYDIMMWILFFPFTLARMAFNPRKTLRYVKDQQNVAEAEAFSDSMRPSIFLVIAIIFSSGLNVRNEIDPLATSSIAKVYVLPGRAPWHA